MEVGANGDRKVGEEVEEAGCAKMTGEKLWNKVDPAREGERSPQLASKDKQSKAGRSSQDQGCHTQQVVNVEAVDEVIEISSDDDDETVDVVVGKKEAESIKEEEVRKELVKSLETQISAMSLELECPVCLNVCAPPIYSCLAQHPVCSGCRPPLKECAVCREPYKQGMIRHRYAMNATIIVYNNT